MIIKCPECFKKVSSYACVCPACGYPLKKMPPDRGIRKKKRRRRLPNGFGQISEIKGKNLKRPFRAMVTIGKDEFGKPVSKPLRPTAYFETYNDAYKALIAYNDNPFFIASDITMKELYEKWSNKHFEFITKKTADTPKAAWAYCNMLYDLKVTEVKIRHLKACLDNGYVMDGTERKYPSLITKVTMKNLMNQLFDYAVENELTDRNYARMFSLPEGDSKKIIENRKSHMRFTEEEMNKLWENINKIPNVDMLLIQCYSGWRPDELCDLEIENINLEDDFMIGGKKTSAGKDRLVPIHSKIKPLIMNRSKKALALKGKYLFLNTKSKKYTYSLYRHHFVLICKRLELNPEHRPHDCRVEFVSLAKKYKVDEYAVKYIVGHSISDLTERVYTKRDPTWLKEEIEKIK